MQGGIEEKLQDIVCILHYSVHRKETYKYFAAIGKTENLFAINKLTLTDFVAHKIFLYDGDRLTDMDLTFSTIKGRPKVSKFQPRTALVRFELLELLLRLSLKKYYDCILRVLSFRQRSYIRSGCRRKTYSEPHYSLLRSIQLSGLS